MEGGALFDPGFLGGQFLWWVGQIPDDATWRDNILPGKFADRDTGAGWGRRYKVRIVGIHDKGEETIPSDQLPWANVMYPVTAGSGAANAWQTPQIRQGNFVFGFFMDGPDQQVPVIMGILGNNAQTKLSTSVGTSEDNFSAVSGFAESQAPPKKQAIPQAPDDDLTIVKPKTSEAQQECAAVPPGTKLNKYGLRPDRPQTAAQFKDAQSATAAAEAEGLSGDELQNKVKEAIAEGTKNRCKQANSPLAAAEPGATLESGACAPHIKSASDLARDDLYREMTPLLKPDGKVESSQKAIQTCIDNLTVKTRKHLKSITEYSTAVSKKIPPSGPGISDMEKDIDQTAKDIAKYEKISVDKMMEYSLKSFNAAAAGTFAAMPSSFRFQYSDVVSGFTQELAAEYLEIGNGLADTVRKVLDQALDLDNKEKAAREEAASLPEDKIPPTYANAAICTSEEMVGKTIALQRDKIDSANNNMMKNLQTFLDDIDGSVAGITGVLDQMKNQLPDIEGSITSALTFENQMPNRFDFEMPPVPALSDFYTMAEGSGAQPDAATPSPMAIGDIASNPLQPFPEIPGMPKIPFAEPSKDQKMVDLLKDTLVDAASEEGKKALESLKDAALEMY